MPALRGTGTHIAHVQNSNLLSAGSLTSYHQKISAWGIFYRVRALQDFFRALEESPTAHTSQWSYVLSPKPTGTKVKSITREHTAAAAKAKLNKNKVSVEMVQPITVKRRKLVIQLRAQPPPAQAPSRLPQIPGSSAPRVPDISSLG